MSEKGGFLVCDEALRTQSREGRERAPLGPLELPVMFRPCADAVKSEEVVQVSSGHPSFSMWVGSLEQPAHPRSTMDLRSLTILRRPSDPIAFLHLQKSEGDSEGPQWDIERSFEQPPSLLCVFLFWQRAYGPVPARMGHEEGGRWAWGRNSFPQDQEKCSA